MKIAIFHLAFIYSGPSTSLAIPEAYSLASWWRLCGASGFIDLKGDKKTI